MNGLPRCGIIHELICDANKGDPRGVYKNRQWDRRREQNEPIDPTSSDHRCPKERQRPDADEDSQARTGLLNHQLLIVHPNDMGFGYGWLSENAEHRGAESGRDALQFPAQ